MLEDTNSLDAAQVITYKDSMLCCTVFSDALDHMKELHQSHITRKPVFGDVWTGKTQTSQLSNRSYIEKVLKV